jgi:hypothetical protein
VADYRGFPLKKASDMEGIVRAFCLEPEIDIVARLQQRFLELVAKQFPEGDEVRGWKQQASGDFGWRAHTPATEDDEDSVK